MTSAHRLWASVAFVVVMGGVVGAVGACQTQPVNPPPPIPREADAPAWEMPERALCHRSYKSVPDDKAQLQDELLVETSGVVPSLKDDTLLWMHNDSGDDSRIYAVDVTGRARLRVTFAGANFVDIEDIAAGPCPDDSGPCLFVADTGDNNHVRSDVGVYVLPEPDVPAFADGAVPVLEVERYWHIPVAFPGGEAIDVEALVVLPDGGGMGFFEKNDDDDARVFQLDAPYLDAAAPTVPRALRLVATLVSPGIAIEYGRMITAADLHPTFDELLVRTYSGVFTFPLPNKSLADVDGQEANVVTYGPTTEAQGEALCYDATGTGLWSVSEDRDHEPGQPLHHYPCE